MNKQFLVKLDINKGLLFYDYVNPADNKYLLLEELNEMGYTLVQIVSMREKNTDNSYYIAIFGRTY